MPGESEFFPGSPGLLFSPVLLLTAPPGTNSMKIKTIFSLLMETFQEWNNDKAPRMGAALAYYTVFSLAPLMFLAIAIAGFVFGEQAARGGIVQELANTIGRPAAQAIEDILRQS